VSGNASFGAVAAYLRNHTLQMVAFEPFDFFLLFNHLNFFYFMLFFICIGICIFIFIFIFILIFILFFGLIRRNHTLQAGVFFGVPYVLFSVVIYIEHILYRTHSVHSWRALCGVFWRHLPLLPYENTFYGEHIL